MSNYYLDFEKPIKALDDQIISLSSLILIILQFNDLLFKFSI